MDTLSVLIEGDIEAHAQINNHGTILVDHDILQGQIAVSQPSGVECFQTLRKERKWLRNAQKFP